MEKISIHVAGLLGFFSPRALMNSIFPRTWRYERFYSVCRIFCKLWTHIFKAEFTTEGSTPLLISILWQSLDKGGGGSSHTLYATPFNSKGITVWPWVAKNQKWALLFFYMCFLFGWQHELFLVFLWFALCNSVISVLEIFLPYLYEPTITVLLVGSNTREASADTF